MKNVGLLVRQKTKGWSRYLRRVLSRADGISAWRVTPDAVPNYRPENFRVMVNYGTGTWPEWAERLPDGVVWLNTPSQVRYSSNKVQMFEALSRGGVRTVPFFTSKDAALAAQQDGRTIVARTVLNGTKGAGIVVCPPGTALPQAHLYTGLIRRRGIREYRVWFVGDTVVDVACKMRYTPERLAEIGVDPDDREKQLIRAHHNGWVFARELPAQPRDWEGWEQITQAVRAANILEWGCIDLLVNSKSGKWWVLEVNSAPGMSDRRTREALRDAIVSTVKAYL